MIVNINSTNIRITAASIFSKGSSAITIIISIEQHISASLFLLEINLLLVQESGGESLITDEAVFSDASTGSGKTNSNNSSSIMTDSLHAVVWEEEEEQ